MKRTWKTEDKMKLGYPEWFDIQMELDADLRTNPNQLGETCNTPGPA